jgi:hypothetical protein
MTKKYEAIQKDTEVYCGKCKKVISGILGKCPECNCTFTQKQAVESLKNTIKKLDMKFLSKPKFETVEDFEYVTFSGTSLKKKRGESLTFFVNRFTGRHDVNIWVYDERQDRLKTLIEMLKKLPDSWRVTFDEEYFPVSLYDGISTLKESLEESIPNVPEEQRLRRKQILGKKETIYKTKVKDQGVEAFSCYYPIETITFDSPISEEILEQKLGIFFCNGITDDCKTATMTYNAANGILGIVPNVKDEEESFFNIEGVDHLECAENMYDEAMLDLWDNIHTLAYGKKFKKLIPEKYMSGKDIKKKVIHRKIRLYHIGEHLFANDKEWALIGDKIRPADEYIEIYKKYK